MQPTISALLLILLPIAGVTIPGILSQDHFPAWVNSLIALAIITAVSAGEAYTANQFNHDILLDFMLTVAGISGLLAGKLQGLDQFLQSNVLSKSEGIVMPLPTPLVASSEPAGIVLPATSGDYTPDASIAPTPRNPTQPIPIVPPTKPENK